MNKENTQNQSQKKIQLEEMYKSTNENEINELAQNCSKSHAG